MRNRDVLEKRTGIISKKSNLDLATDIAKKWHGKCVYHLCPAYEGFNDSDCSGLCSLGIGEESTEKCIKEICTWLSTVYVKREKGWFGD